MANYYYQLERLPFDELPNLAEFIVNENFKHHSNGAYPLGYEDKINAVFQEELNYFENSLIYVAKDVNAAIIGSIRVLKWNGLDVLPIQKLFDIDIPIINGCLPANTVWHIGRFAIRKGVRDVNLLKQLMVCAIAPVCQNQNAVVYAECDKKLLRILLALGIKAQPIGKPLSYLGSETVPIKMTCAGLINFYTNHKHLILTGLFAPTIKNNKTYTFG